MTTIFRTYNELADVPLNENSWDRLVALSNTGGIFLQHLWIRKWWQHFGHSYALHFITAEDDGEVLAFAPLMIDTKRTLRFIGDTNADYLGFVIPKGNTSLLTGFLQHLVKSRDQWRVMHLKNMERDPDAGQRLSSLLKQIGLIPWNNYSVKSPYLPISNNEKNVDILLNSYRNRRSMRQIAALGEITYEVFGTSDRAAHYWDLFAQQHVVRCLRDGRTSPFSDARYLSFLRSLLESNGANGRVHFSGLFIGDEAVAFHIGFISQGRLLWYKPSFDISIRKGSPGIVLICNLIRHAIEIGAKELDFTIGEETFKDRFCDKYRIVDTMRVYKSYPYYVIESGYWRLRQNIKNLMGKYGYG